MRKKLPKKWCIRANTVEEAQIIAEYADPLSKVIGSRWLESDSLIYYLQIKEGKYINGDPNPPSGYSILTFEEFKVLVLGEKPTEPNYEIY